MSSTNSWCCRLCLADRPAALRPIFAEGGMLVRQILTCVGVEVTQMDKLPTVICESCRGKVTAWEEFRRLCSENQVKLQNRLVVGWSENPDVDGMTIQIKDEPIDDRQDSTDIVTIKSEPFTIDEDYYEHPPILSPHRPSLEDDELIATNINEQNLKRSSSDFVAPAVDSLKVKTNKECLKRDKSFSTSGNRSRHEKKCQIGCGGVEEKALSLLNASVSSNHEELSRNSIDSQISRNGSLPPSLDSEAELSENDVQKIQFAAGLRLKSKSLNQIGDLPHAKPDDAPISKMEESYIEKNKALLSMIYSFRCACHNGHYNSVKRLFAHLRANYNWFPTYTCYNCLITFSERAHSMRHYRVCPRGYLENCIRMAEIKRRTEDRVRLYQYYKCTTCRILFAFHEDYKRHIDREHHFKNTLICKCTKTFQTKEEFKNHIYNSCYLNIYCDVCYTSYSSIPQFEKHCEMEHDKITECSFVEYHEDFRLVDPSEIVNSRKRKFSETEVEMRTDLKSPEKEYTNNTNNEKRIKIDDENIEKSPPPTIRIKQDLLDDDHTFSYNLRSPNRANRLIKNLNLSPHGHNGWKNLPSQCDICQKEFSTYYNMVRHKKVHDESEKHLQCSFCFEKFRLISELKDHLNAVHGEAHICQECGKQFETFKQLDQHRAVHLNIKVYLDSKTLAYSTKQPFPCLKCSESFESELELSKHLPIHTQIKQEKENGYGKFSCFECNKHYLGKKGLWMHNKRHHPNRKPPQQPFKCDVCDRVLMTNAALASHRLSHDRVQATVTTTMAERNEDDDDYFTCKHCFKVFSSKYNLRTHLKTHGINVAGGRSNSKTGKVTKTFWCDVCHQACNGYDELQEHKQEHLNETESVEDIEVKPNVSTCELCSKVFITRLGFVKHQQRHERLKNLKGVVTKKGSNFVYCKYCRVPFMNINSLNQHMIKEHDEGIKPNEKSKSQKKFVCNICKRAFDTSGALCSHQGWHKRSNPGKLIRYVAPPKETTKHKSETITTTVARNSCNSCGLSFATETALQIHKLEVHRNVNATLISPRCTICKIEFANYEEYDAHQKMHVKLPPVTFQCKYCPKQFPNCEGVNVHINTNHPEYTDGKNKCHECCRYFEKPNALTIHLKVHDRQRAAQRSGGGISVKEAKPNKVFTCSICFASFEIAKELRNHIITTHPF